MESPLSEIKPLGTKNTTETITAVKWSTLSRGQLSILVGGYTLSTYDTVSAGSRPIFTSSFRTSKPIMSFAKYPFSNTLPSNDGTSKEVLQKAQMMRQLFLRQVVAVDCDHNVDVVATQRVAPISISPRTGQIIHSIGQTLFTGSLSDGHTAMEGLRIQIDEDISKITLRRALGTSTGKYSMDVSTNIDFLTEEISNCNERRTSASTEKLLRLWKWIQLAEGFCQSDVQQWPAKSLVEAGVMKLLELDAMTSIKQSKSASLFCFVYESEGRR
jgi:hypothetical protein